MIDLCRRIRSGGIGGTVSRRDFLFNAFGAISSAIAVFGGSRLPLSTSQVDGKVGDASAAERRCELDITHDNQCDYLTVDPKFGLNWWQERLHIGCARRARVLQVDPSVVKHWDEYKTLIPIDHAFRLAKRYKLEDLPLVSLLVELRTSWEDLKARVYGLTGARINLDEEGEVRLPAGFEKILLKELGAQADSAAKMTIEVEGLKQMQPEVLTVRSRYLSGTAYACGAVVSSLRSSHPQPLLHPETIDLLLRENVISTIKFFLDPLPRLLSVSSMTS